MNILSAFNLSGKTALVTGCNRGIGMGMAIGLAEAGANIIGVSASLAPGSEVEKQVTALGRSFQSYQADFSSRESIYNFLGQLADAGIVPDILVNNAGTIMRNPAANTATNTGIVSSTSTWMHSSSCPEKSAKK